MTADAIEPGPVHAGSGLDWRPPRWILWASVVAQSCLWLTGLAAAAVCFFAASHAWWSLVDVGALLALLTWPLAVLIHELGHVASARMAGMTVGSAQVSWVFLQAQRRGWRMRLQRPPRGTSGFVWAFMDPSRRLRGQCLLAIAGGPFASLAVALCFGATGVWFVPGPAGLALMGFAAMNLATGLIALLPSDRFHPSDGLQLWCWLRGVDESSPDFYLQQLNGLSVAGTPADELPADKVAALAMQGQPGSMLGIWFRLKAHQNRGEWSLAAAMDPEIEVAVSALPSASADGLKDLISILRCEVRFSSAMRDWSVGQSPAESLTPFASWALPSLTARCDSLMVALSGDRAGAVRRLDEVELLASRSVDRALAISEGKIRRALLSRLDSNGLCPQ